MAILPFTSPGRPLATATPLVSSGTAPTVGTSNKVARQDHVHPRYDWQAADYSMISWAFDPAFGVNSSALGTAGLVYVVRLHVPIATNVTNICIYLVTLGNTLTSGQCFAALWQGGTLLGTTSDQSAVWATPGTTGFKVMPISGGAVAVAAGDVYVGFWFQGTTGPAFARSAGTAVGNLGLTATASRFGTADTGRTTTAPNPLGTISQYTLAYWAALS